MPYRRPRRVLGLHGDAEPIDAALDRAHAAYAADRLEDARAIYLAVLARAPDHVRALGDFGTLLLKTGYRAAAQTVFARAVAVAPDDARTHANLGTVRFALNDYEGARASYATALVRDPELVTALQGMSYALVRLGRDDEAAAYRRRGFAGRAVQRGAFRGSGTPVDVLLVTVAGGGALYADAILDDRVFRTTTLVADAYAGEPIPPHDVVFNAISDADRAPRALAAVADAFASSRVALVNRPERVLATARVANAARLATLDGVVAPRAASFPREALTRDDGAAALAAAGFGFPVLLRAPGYHTGEHFERVDDPRGVAAAARALPGRELLALAFADVRDPDGWVRKYRVLFVDGVLYPLHLAISGDWKVHYLTADMATVAAHRDEERRFLADPNAVLGAARIAALARVRDLLGLDYAGVDFALAPNGRIVVFEANATMIVVPPGPEAIWDYRRPYVARILDAARAMLVARAHAGREGGERPT